MAIKELTLPNKDRTYKSDIRGVHDKGKPLLEKYTSQSEAYSLPYRTFVLHN
jgi:hypothetical protein